MLKSSSLCLHSSNLGTFWLKIEQFWPFEEISIFSNSGHLKWRAGLSDTDDGRRTTDDGRRTTDYGRKVMTIGHMA